MKDMDKTDMITIGMATLFWIVTVFAGAGYASLSTHSQYIIPVVASGAYFTGMYASVLLMIARKVMKDGGFKENSNGERGL